MDKFVFLDLDDTLLDFKKCERAALSEAMARFGIATDGESTDRYSAINDMMWKRLERGEATRDEVLTERFRLFLATLGREDVSPANARREYEKALSTKCFFIDGAKELLERLYGKYRLFIVSNGTAHVQDGRIAASGIGGYFEDIFISHRIGFDKPDRRFFDYCFSRIDGFDRARAIIAGDSLTSDIRGGKNAGIATVWFNPRRVAGEAEPDFEIHALSELCEVLERW